MCGHLRSLHVDTRAHFMWALALSCHGLAKMHLIYAKLQLGVYMLGFYQDVLDTIMDLCQSKPASRAIAFPFRDGNTPPNVDHVGHASAGARQLTATQVYYANLHDSIKHARQRCAQPEHPLQRILCNEMHHADAIMHLIIGNDIQ